MSEPYVRSEWLQASYDIQDDMRSIAGSLSLLADAFYRTGNGQVAKELDGYVVHLKDAAQQLSESTARKVSEDYKQSVENTGSILTALIGGISMGQKDGENEVAPS